MVRGGSRGEDESYAYPLTSHFLNVFDVYNFSIISNLFDGDKLYVLSTHNRKCANKMQLYLAKHSELESKNLIKICVIIIQKALK